jgi:pyruvate/2-oxoglutarate dehydrogenase complex dihydrolipoamide dehydrogenase (E3) component
MTNLKHCDLCIVGGGGAGLAAARAAAGLGAKVVVVERRSLGGGYLAQTIPAQAFCAGALQMGAAQNLAPGIPRIAFSAFRARVLAAVKDFTRDYALPSLAALNIELVRGHGSFSRTNRLEVGGAEIEAKHFILATGATLPPSALPGQDLIRPLLFEDLLTLDRAPDELLVVGGSLQSLTLAQAFLRLGSRVTLIEPEAILPREDPELIAPVLTQLAREGLNRLSAAKIANIEPSRNGLRAHLEGSPTAIDAAHILLAGHPLPLVEGLGLKNAQVTYANSGILIDANGRTSNRRIYAVGDAAGGPNSPMSALGEAVRITRRLLGHAASSSPIARILETDPEMAAVGLTEAQAREKHRQISVLRAPIGATSAARLKGAKHGHLKIVTNSAGHILGAGIVGAQSREIMGIFSLAMEHRIRVSELDLAANAPTLTEVASKAALATGTQVSKALQWRDFLSRRTR